MTYMNTTNYIIGSGTVCTLYGNCFSVFTLAIFNTFNLLQKYFLNFNSFNPRWISWIQPTAIGLGTLSVQSIAITFVFFYFGNWNEICLIICQIILNFNSFYPISLKLKTLPSNINSFHPIWLSVIGSSSVQSTAITFVLFDFAIFLWIYMKNTSIQLSFNPIWLANEYNCYWLRDLFPPIHCNYFWGFLTMSIFY